MTLPCSRRTPRPGLHLGWCFRFKILFALAFGLAYPGQRGAAADSASSYDTPLTAAKHPAFAIQGEYRSQTEGLQVIAAGEDDFEMVVYSGGLPGAGWNGLPPQRLEGNADDVQATIARRAFQRAERTSETMGAAPPPGAIVLFDGTQASLDRHWESGAQRTEEGHLLAGATTRETFRDYRLHLEFRTPFKPKARGQARGNSGVYHQGRYETQILDSFGLEGKNNEAGGIYEVRNPDLNACFPPLAWQTYDVDFTAPRFDSQGNKVQDARLTVRLNGILVHRDARVPGVTRSAIQAESNAPGPIHLQQHGNAVHFRNLWLLPRDADTEALRPFLAGSERFSNEPLTSGRLLIADLGCTACHAADASDFRGKQPPVLDRVAERVQPEHLIAMIAAPETTKRGTTMPGSLHALPVASRDEEALAIASYLSKTGQATTRFADRRAMVRGKELYHSIGCAACHAPREEHSSHELTATSIPLGDITQKYTLSGLTRFLLDPLAVRPTGHMPKLVQNRGEAQDVACYLIGDETLPPEVDRFRVTLFEGAWDNLPNFDEIQPKRTVNASQIDVGIAGLKNHFGLRFDTFFPVEIAGDYTFHLSSDDGSRLLVDNQEWIRHDGIHPATSKRVKRRLEAGIYPLRVEYFQGEGEQQLSLEVEGPDFARSGIECFAQLRPDSHAAATASADMNRSQQKWMELRADPALIERGRDLFVARNCAACHVLHDGEAVVQPSWPAPPPRLESLDPQRGCLAETVASHLPHYRLTREQKQAIGVALAALGKAVSDDEAIHFQLASRNCYACHSRLQVSSPELIRDASFKSTIPEMGNEGRLPPPLTGVGDKLLPAAIERIVAQGAKDRPYMTTRMPGFGKHTLSDLRDRLIRVDQRTSEKRRPPVALEAMSTEDLAADGRRLVGNAGLACIKCHRWGNKPTPGLQAIDLTTMAGRLREDWFHRYLLAPAEYRPGTRMPLSFPEGKSVLTDLYDGDAEQQIHAMWRYLSQGAAAKPPVGTKAESIVLKPDQRPILYRNFIRGLTPRGIAVGYPEQVHLAWDAGNMNLAMMWKNEFIDAGMHWSGRGPGAQDPLGDFVMPFEATAPIAQLASPEEKWPTTLARERGYRFLGYVLNRKGEPTFRYRFGTVLVEDHLEPRKSEKGPLGFDRELRIQIETATTGLVMRHGQGDWKMLGEGKYRRQDKLSLDIQGIDSSLMTIGDREELRSLLPVAGELTIRQSIRW